METTISNLHNAHSLKIRTCEAIKDFGTEVPPHVLMTQYAGGLSFHFAMTPLQALALAEALQSAAHELIASEGAQSAVHPV